MVVLLSQYSNCMGQSHKKGASHEIFVRGEISPGDAFLVCCRLPILFRMDFLPHNIIVPSMPITSLIPVYASGWGVGFSKGGGGGGGGPPFPPLYESLLLLHTHLSIWFHSNFTSDNASRSWLS